MAIDTVKDSLDHPCAIAEALDRFSVAVGKTSKRDRHAAAHQIARGLNDLVDRSEHMFSVLELARDSLADPDAAEQVRSTLEMAKAYSVETSNRLFWLAGHILVALQNGNQLEVQRA